MLITPCRTCHIANGCGIRLSKIKAVRGLKLTSIKFKCDLLKESFQPGMKVQADLKYVAVGYTHEEHELRTVERTVEAVVMGWSREKVRIYIPYDDGGEWWLQSLKNEAAKIHVLRVLPNQLHPYGDFERVTVCTHCGLPKDSDLQNWGCSNVFDGETALCEYPETPSEFAKELNRD